MIVNLIKKSKFLLSILIILILLIFGSSVVFAWLCGSGIVESELIEGSILTQYFHCGDGTVDIANDINNPFVITRPVHYYNLVYLYQRKEGYGYTDSDGNKISFEDIGYHYQLGYDFFSNEHADGSSYKVYDYPGSSTYTLVSSSEDFYVYNYDDAGQIVLDENGNPTFTKVLNLTSYTDGLLPIGTSVIPFNGEFDGKDLTISGLKIISNVEFVEGTYGSCDVGVFGYLSSISNVHNLYISNATIDLTDTSDTFISDGSTLVSDETTIHSTSIHEDSSGACIIYVGYIAGHVKIGSQVQDVYVNDSSILGGIKAESGFGYFGCVEEKDSENSIPTLGDQIATLRTQGEGAGFGGSLDMKTFFNRIKDAINNLSNKSKAEPIKETITEDGYNITVTQTSNGDNYFYSKGLSGNYAATGTSTGSTIGQYAFIYGLTYSECEVTVVNKDSKEVDGYYISYNDGNNEYYLTFNGTTLVSQTGKTNASGWIFDDNNKLYTVYNNTIYYLLISDETLSAKNIASSQAPAWTISNNVISTNVNNITYSLSCLDGIWFGYSSNLSQGIISDNSGHYLVNNNTNIITSTTLNSNCLWKVGLSNSEYTFSKKINNNTYYLSINSEGNLSLNQVPFNWKTDDFGIYANVGTNKIYIVYYNNEFRLNTFKTLYINDNNGNYLKANGNNTFTNSTKSDATIFMVSYINDTDSTKVKMKLEYIYNDVVYNFGNNNANFSNTATLWTYNDGNMYGNGNYYLNYNNSAWRLSLGDVTYYIKNSSNYYLVHNTNNNGFSRTSNVTNASAWVFSEGESGGSISYVSNGTTYYLAITTSTTGDCISTTNYNLSLVTTNNNNSKWDYVDGELKNRQYSSYYLTIGSTPSVNQSGDTIVLESNLNTSSNHSLQEEGTSLSLESLNANKSVLTQARENTTLAMESIKISLNVEVSIVKRGTYIPLKVIKEGEEGYNSNMPYQVASDNTGYLVGGNNFTQGGDMRISYYGLSNINNSYNTTSGLHDIYTYTAQGARVKINSSGTGDDIKYYPGNNTTKVYEKYGDVFDSFEDILQSDNTNVYGLHFMNATISKNNLIQAEVVKICGKTYINYDLPEDSIDFTLVEPGYITFMSGAYFANGDVNTFFSLHQVFRNKSGCISDIREIKKIYKESNSIFPKYLYQYDGDSDFTSSELEGYELAFDTICITNPESGNGAITKNYIYYFEIPCNSGEYCLGSVSGKTGAYLNYLDIGANGGAIKESIVSGEGNGVADSFNTEFRDSPDQTDNNIIQIGFNIPTSATNENFDVRVEFDKDDTGEEDEYENGCYHIYITNNTTDTIVLNVLLCDDDGDLTNVYTYSYKLYYKNASNTDYVILERFSGLMDYWKVAGTFEIPSTGNASSVYS